jgi:hypothetical protein
MAYYKREGEELIVAPNGVDGPGYSLTPENYSEHTYPVSGWYWFDTLDQALDNLPRTDGDLAVSPLQLCAALVHFGLYDQVKAAVAQADPFTQLAWEKAIMFKRNSPTLLSFAAQLGISDSEIDAIFAYAAGVVA